MTHSTGSKQKCTTPQAQKVSALTGLLASTTIFIITILLKPRTEKFFKDSSGQSMGVTNGKAYL
jgi:hypothetical protein